MKGVIEINKPSDVRALCKLVEGCIFHHDINDDVIEHRVSVSMLSSKLHDSDIFKHNE